MICKFCNAEIGDEFNFCPICGKSLAEEVSVEAEQVQTPEEAVSQELPVEETPEEAISQEIPEKPKKKVWPLVLAIVGAVVALGVLAVVLLIALGVDLKPKANDLQYKTSYVLEDAEAAKKSDAVVAEIGGEKLTNAQLQIFYNMQVADFVNYYGSYLSYIGFDATKPLGEQTCSLDETLTWEQYFIKVSIETWQNYQTMALLAKDAGYELDGEIAAQILALPETLNEQAVQSGYENAEALIKEFLGESCTVSDYVDYIHLMYLSNEYYSSEYARLSPTDEDVEAYFTQHEAELKETGITKDSGLVSDVRHILVLFEGGTTDEEGNTTYSEDEKAVAYAEAERILNEWKAGEATEASFGELANKYTDDPGSQTTGGLYQGIAPGSNYYENFLAWSIDMSRQPGDTDIVETHAGYHIMYFVSGEDYWITTCRTALATERTTALIESGEEKYPMKVNYKKIALCDIEMG